MPLEHPSQTAVSIAEHIREASLAGRPLVPWGAGTRQHLGGPPPEGAAILPTAALGSIREHSPPDLTATVEAGVTLGALQAALAEHGQWLPWDPPRAAEATIGGLLATAASGPLRLGCGTPRDWMLGMRVALGDGRLVKSGGRVVKNVAGYDLHKLHIGALGTLGVIVEITFKVFPLPEHSATLRLECRDRATALVAAARLRERPLAPVSLAVFNHQPPATAFRPPATNRSDDKVRGWRETGEEAAASALFAPRLAGGLSGATVLVVRFAGVPAAVERQARVAVALGATPLDEADAAALWRLASDFPAPTGDELLIRAGAPPSELGAVLDALGAYAPGGATELLGYPGVGLAYARWQPTSDAADALAGVRAALARLGGYAVVESAPPPLRATLDLWGPPPGTLRLMQALKRQWDPQGILNPGRYLA
jgi:glycolate oxidase FAD binding subunit